MQLSAALKNIWGVQGRTTISSSFSMDLLLIITLPIKETRFITASTGRVRYFCPHFS